MTWNTDWVAVASLCLLCFVAGVVFAAHRQLRLERRRRWLSKTRSI